MSGRLTLEAGGEMLREWGSWARTELNKLDASLSRWQIDAVRSAWEVDELGEMVQTETNGHSLTFDEARMEKIEEAVNSLKLEDRCAFEVIKAYYLEFKWKPKRMVDRAIRSFNGAFECLL